MEEDEDLDKYSSLHMGKSPLRNTSYRNRTDTEDSTMYLDYPPNKPFINDDYERPPYKPVSSYPEGNRKAVISALKNLQDKIHQLEVERTAAEDNLKSLASETNRYRDILQKESEQRQPAQTNVSKHSQELESQLSAAETRCTLLEQQLGYMQNMVTGAEKDRVEAVRKSAELDALTDPPTERSSGFENNLKKIAELEREHIKLTANQSLAESKIRELEEKLGEERHHRKLMVEKSAEIESVQKANKILQQADDYESSKAPVKTKKVKKKKKPVVCKKSPHAHKPDASKHYRLNLAEIPFVAGKNTGPSHSVSANIQRVFALMKNHNMALCSRATHSVGCCQQESRRSSSSSSSPTTESDLADILLQLQDEFHQMSFEHQEFSKEINDTSDPRVREDLERELDALVSKMEAKSQQIAKIRKHQDRIASKKKKKSREVDTDEESTPRAPRARSAHAGCVRGARSPRYNGEVEVTTTIKPRSGAGVVQIRPSSAREISLNVLKDMRKLQSTLRKDDLCWK